MVTWLPWMRGEVGLLGDVGGGLAVRRGAGDVEGYMTRYSVKSLAT